MCHNTEAEAKKLNGESSLKEHKVYRFIIKFSLIAPTRLIKFIYRPPAFKSIPLPSLLIHNIEEFASISHQSTLDQTFCSFIN